MSAFPVYTLKNNGVTISTAITVLQLAPGTAGPVEILRASLTQKGLTTSAVNETARVVQKSAAATVTTAVADTHLFKQNQAFGTSNAVLGTAATGITASAEGTDSRSWGELGFHPVNGYMWLPTDAEQIVIPQSGFCGIKFSAAPASSTWYGELVFRELRGG